MSLVFITDRAKARICADLEDVAMSQRWTPQQLTTAQNEVSRYLVDGYQIPDGVIPGPSMMNLTCGFAFPVDVTDMYLDTTRGKIVAAGRRN